MKSTPEYKRLKALGWKDKDARRCAKIRERFEELETQGLVRFRVEPDQDWSSPLDMDGTPEDLAAVEARMDQEGVWGIVVEAKCSCCGSWEHVSSVWGFVGDDWRDSYYDTDLMLEAMNHRPRKVA